MQNKTSFVLHLDSLIIFNEMSNEQIGIMMRSLYQYQLTGKLPELEFGIKMAITPFINQFKRDDEKWVKVVERNKHNGSKGGRPKTQNNPEEPKKPSGLSHNPEEPTVTLKDKDKDKDNVNKSIKLELIEQNINLSDKELTKLILFFEQRGKIHKKVTNSQNAIKKQILRLKNSMLFSSFDYILDKTLLGNDAGCYQNIIELTYPINNSPPKQSNPLKEINNNDTNKPIGYGVKKCK